MIKKADPKSDIAPIQFCEQIAEIFINEEIEPVKIELML